MEHAASSMLVRENQIIQGYTAIRGEVLKTLNDMIYKNLTGVIHLRGSISTSGDLMPLNFDVYYNYL